MLNMSFPSSQNNTLNLWTKSKVLIYFHIFQPPYPTLQNNTLNRRRKLAFWVNFVIYHPSTLPDNMLNLWKKLTGWFFLIGLPHQNTTFNIVEHMNQRSILSYVWNIVSSRAKQHVDYEHRGRVKSVYFFYASPRHKTIWMLNTWNKLRSWASFEIYSPPDLTMKLTCWVGSLLQTCPPVPYKTLRPFNIRANLASRVMIQMSFPSPSTKQYVEQIKTIHLESFLKVTTPRPYTAVR